MFKIRRATIERRQVMDSFYNREVLVEVLVYHYHVLGKGCGCGWAELGKSWPEHVATVYEESVRARKKQQCKNCGTTVTDMWWKCCPEHTPERSSDVMCDGCAIILHPNLLKERNMFKRGD